MHAAALPSGHMISYQGAESVLESPGRAAFHQFGLAPPDLQVWVGDDNEVIGRADFL